MSTPGLYALRALEKSGALGAMVVFVGGAMGPGPEGAGAAPKGEEMGAKAEGAAAVSGS